MIKQESFPNSRKKAHRFWQPKVPAMAVGAAVDGAEDIGSAMQPEALPVFQRGTRNTDFSNTLAVLSWF